MEDAPAGMYKGKHDCVEDVIGSLGTIVCQCLVAGILAEPSDDLYSHFAICPTAQDGMTKRYGWGDDIHIWNAFALLVSWGCISFFILTEL